MDYIYIDMIRIVNLPIFQCNNIIIELKKGLRLSAVLQIVGL